MVMPHATERWTAERVRALPDDGRRYELIEGELVVTPAPRGLHQVAIRELVRHLDPWLRDWGIAELLFAPADLALGEDEVLQPDLFVYRTANRKPLHDWSDITELLLVIEVLSPSTRALRSSAQAAPLPACRHRRNTGSLISTRDSLSGGAGRRAARGADGSTVVDTLT